LIKDQDQYIQEQIRDTINCTRDYAWIRIPKTGSQSIKSLICNDKQHTHFSALGLVKIIGTERYDELFKFTIVRNPWDRLVSCYHFYNHKDSSFESWVKNGMKVQSGLRKSILRPLQPILQFGWFTDDNGNSMVDFIGRLENIDEDWKIICENLKIKSTKIPHKNRSRRR